MPLYFAATHDMQRKGHATPSEMVSTPPHPLAKNENRRNKKNYQNLKHENRRISILIS